MVSHYSFMLMAAASADRALPADRSPTPLAASEVVQFWREAGPPRWFAKDPAFDRAFRERFQDGYAAAARGRLAHWMATAEGALALCILLDQYPRNSFRGSPRMYATDALAREIAGEAIDAGYDRACAPSELALFMYLPFGHSESLADQERSVELSKRFGEPMAGRAVHHCEIVRRFGRFPHRNAILGRETTVEEQRFLDEGGFAG